ncbi:MAG: LacI family DNA-binding transcriptional regulator [Solirubrobacterales bacterium]|nr:LacI family DNA-binding transcriptional regulator [Solirubrobacterales bacterium]
MKDSNAEAHRHAEPVGEPFLTRRRAVMADVGRLAGVSHQTVSRVINGSPHVRAQTRQRVLEAMLELGYRPNSAARALVTGRSQTLGVVSFDTTLYGPASTLFGIERAAHEAGYFIIVASLKVLDRRSVSEAVERLCRQGVDGILAITPYDEGADALLHAPGDVPLVAVEAGPDHGVPVVAIDQVAGAQSATRHLLDLGHETVWHIAGALDFLESRDRVHGWRSAIEAAGAPQPPLLTGDWSARAGYDLGRGLASDTSVTAVFVANDQMALGVLRAMQEGGRRIPEEVSVVGFDDIPEAPYFLPPLTTVRQDFDHMGSQSVRQLVGMLEAAGSAHPPAPLRPELIVRASTAVAARVARARASIGGVTPGGPGTH